MRKPRLHISALILVLLISISMLATADEGPIIGWNNGGPVAALGFYFSEPLTIPFPGFEFEVSEVDIETTGKELSIIWPSTGDFFYTGKYGNGIVYTDGEVFGEQVIIPMISGRIYETGTLDEIPENPLIFDAPDNVNLYFKANLLDPLAWFIFGEVVVLKFEMLVLNGEVVSVEITEQTSDDDGDEGDDDEDD